ncbi:MAG: DUF2190 family protein [Gammaproteobacteria bacterium]|nr:DUF2190 family protein [Gammaproteobacteria bacterium]
MANNIDGPEITLKASGSLSSYQFHIVTLDTDGKVKLADNADDPAEALIGILENKPTAEDQAAVVRVSGIAKVMGGDSVDEGVWLTCDGSGHAVAATANDNVIGVAIDAVVSDSVGRVLLAQGAGYVAPA